MEKYFKNRIEMSTRAKSHTAKMTIYNDLTNYSINNSKIYSPNSIIKLNTDPNDVTSTKVMELDSVSAALYTASITDKKICILNFASYKHPGGKFIDGSSAQEESLCHASNLYNILSSFDSTYYEENRKNLNRGLYTDRAIYTPNVQFFSADEKHIGQFDVITCAAPNYSVSKNYGSFTKDENLRCLRSRIRFILSIMSENNVDTAILGAFGCGVFKQDPYEVATIFKEELKVIPIKNVIFAIPGGSNLVAFLEVL